MAGLSPPCSRGSLFTSRSGDRAVLLGLGVPSSTSSANELHLFRDSVNGRLRRNSRETVLQQSINHGVLETLLERSLELTMNLDI